MVTYIYINIIYVVDISQAYTWTHGHMKRAMADLDLQWLLASCASGPHFSGNWRGLGLETGSAQMVLGLSCRMLLALGARLHHQALKACWQKVLPLVHHHYDLANHFWIHEMVQHEAQYINIYDQIGPLFPSSPFQSIVGSIRTPT